MKKDPATPLKYGKFHTFILGYFSQEVGGQSQYVQLFAEFSVVS